jgi:hypothetical protein
MHRLLRQGSPQRALLPLPPLSRPRQLHFWHRFPLPKSSGPLALCSVSAS